MRQVLDSKTFLSCEQVHSRLRGEHLTQCRGESLGCTRLAILVAEESAVAAREHDRRRAESFGNGDRATMGQFALGFGACGDDDPGWCLAERIETKLVVGTRNDVLPQQRIVAGAVVLFGHDN